MLNPNIGKLINSCENRYNLVLEIAKRARTISEIAQKNEETIVEKPVSLAINEIARERHL